MNYLIFSIKEDEGGGMGEGESARESGKGRRGEILQITNLGVVK